MRLLLFSDLHADTTATRRLVEQAGDVDVLIGAGDFANARYDLDVCIDILRQVSKPTVLVAGNNETTEELRAACEGWSSAHVLHGTGITIDGVTFFGVGGGIPITPFGAWSYDFSEEQATDLLADCPKGCVLITHSPPRGAVDIASNGKNLGSTAIRAAIERVIPRLVVCGHIHGSSGQQDTIGPTTVINAGPNGIRYELNER